MTFHEKVEPLSTDEKGLLKGGYEVIDFGEESSLLLDLTNRSECKNTNCPSSAKNSNGCTNTNCTMCNCSCPTTNPCSNNPCGSIGGRG